MSDFTQLPPLQHLPTPSNTFPRDVMHHARIDHHSRSIGRRKFEGGLPLRAALLVQGPVDLVQSDPWSWRTPQETTRLATENGSFTGNNGDFTNKYTWEIMVDIIVDIADVCLPSWCITNISLGAMVDITRADGVYKPPCGIYIYKVYNN